MLQQYSLSLWDQYSSIYPSIHLFFYPSSTNNKVTTPLIKKRENKNWESWLSLIRGNCFNAINTSLFICERFSVDHWLWDRRAFTIREWKGWEEGEGKAILDPRIHDLRQRRSQPNNFWWAREQGKLLIINSRFAQCAWRTPPLNQAWLIYMWPIKLLNPVRWTHFNSQWVRSGRILLFFPVSFK